MRLSESGLALLKELEGSRATPYKDIAWLLTIGVGHCLTRSECSSGKIVITDVPVRYAQGLTDAQIDALLRQDLAPVEAALHETGLAFTAGQFDALACWIFNVGIGAFRSSTLLKKLHAGDYASIPEQLRRWRMAGGKIITGLVRRREREILRWLAPEAMPPMRPDALCQLDGPALAQWAHDHGLGHPSVAWRQGPAPHLYIRDTQCVWRPWVCVSQADKVVRSLRAAGWTTMVKGLGQAGWCRLSRGEVGIAQCWPSRTAPGEAHALLLVSCLAVLSEQGRPHG